MAYVDYEYYASVYGGTLVPENIFSRVEKKAEIYLDSITHGRLNDENVDKYENLKDCVCEMADTVFSFSSSSDKNAGKEKKSETIDGYSVTYVTETTDGSDSVANMRKKLYSIARFYLSGTGLLSLAIPCCQIRT